MESQFEQCKKLFKKQAVMSLFACLAIIIAAAILMFADIFEFYIGGPGTDEPRTLVYKFSLYIEEQISGIFFLFFVVFYGVRGITNFIRILDINNYAIARCKKIFKRRNNSENNESKRRFWFTKISFFDVFDTTLIFSLFYFWIIDGTVSMINNSKSIYYKELCKCDFVILIMVGVICLAVFIFYDLYSILTLRKSLKEIMNNKELEEDLSKLNDNKHKEI